MRSLSHTPALLDYFRQARFSVLIDLSAHELFSMSALA
jgi:hypothetical protein